MKVKIDYPPNILAIDAVFHTEGKTVFYCYGDTIYNPHSLYLPEFIKAHELAHSISQGKDPKGWWERYLVDPEFRYREELDGHRAEMQFVLATTKDRNYSAKILNATAARLSSPLYQHGKTFNQAQQDLRTFVRKI